VGGDEFRLRAVPSALGFRVLVLALAFTYMYVHTYIHTYLGEGGEAGLGPKLSSCSR
jgi:hypothetical protein